MMILDKKYTDARKQMTLSELYLNRSQLDSKSELI